MNSLYWLLDRLDLSRTHVDEQETLALLRSLHTEVDQAYELVQQFAHMVRTRMGEQLDEWLCRVKASRIRELQGCVAGVIRDKEAVKAGLTLSASNGIVEDKINKLKLIKRMGYGRAGFPLLRKPGPPCLVGSRKGSYRTASPFGWQR